MKSLDSFANKVGSLTTEAVQACAHGFGVIGSGFGHGNTTSVKAKGFVSYPSALSSCRCYPDAGFSSSMDYGQSPLGLKLQNFRVSNHFGSNWIDNLNPFFFEHKFWSNPDQVGDDRKSTAEHQFENSLWSAIGNHKAVGRKENNQNHCCPSPNKVAPRSKGFSHHTIIAGEAE